MAFLSAPALRHRRARCTEPLSVCGNLAERGQHLFRGARDRIGEDRQEDETAELDPRIAAVLWELFGEEPLAAQSMMYYKPPGARGQGLHQDQMPLRVSPGQCVAAWIALDRADGENGGMLVVPGSHRLGVVCSGREANEREFYDGGGLRIPEGCQVLQTEMGPGDALFFGGLMIHGSYANRSHERFRRCFIGHYVGRSTESLAKFYHPLLTMAGEEVGVAPATGGGPCGARDLAGPH
jgi:phytanoyl-CoA hydroxylase